MDALHSSEASVIVYQPPWRNIPNNIGFHQHHCENLTSYTLLITKKFQKIWYKTLWFPKPCSDFHVHMAHGC